MRILVRRLQNTTHADEAVGRPKTFAIIPLQEGLQDEPLPYRLAAALRAMGYKVRNVAGTDDVFGGYQAILFQKALGLKAPPEWVTRGDPPVNGVYHGASDFRKDGEAVGW